MITPGELEDNETRLRELVGTSNKMLATAKVGGKTSQHRLGLATWSPSQAGMLPRDDLVANFDRECTKGMHGQREELCQVY